ncbi:hypothetical protein [Roseomonas sp. HF4]|uniref:hypothetical protein n=1 Tax=Roseomonas sp. HF4 TaxID=2562313 RepID=UPI0010C15360|nr:hypothetical protein [Roseomonas sp. HF4]
MTFSNADPDTSCGENTAEQPPRHPTGGAARQARYRAMHQLRSIDVRAQIQERIARLCAETSRNTQALLTLALDCLEERLHQEQPKSATPRRKRLAAEEPSPVMADLFGQELS